MDIDTSARIFGRPTTSPFQEERVYLYCSLGRRLVNLLQAVKWINTPLVPQHPHVHTIHSVFPSSPRQANGVNIAGFYIGAGLGSLCIAMAEAIGWRATCYSVAGCGFFLAFIWLFTVKEPARVILANTLTTPPVDSVETGQNGQGTRDPEEDRVYTLKQR